MIAYDLETTRIQAGTPEPRFVTAYGDGFEVCAKVQTIEQLRDVIITRFLDPELSRTRFVAWNGNKFDGYLISAALLHSPEYEIRPYLTRNKSLRGMRIVLKREPRIFWEFLDGMAMTGIQKPLKDFLKVFAPDYQKLDGPDFERVEFNADDPQHVAYARRDSEGLFHAMQRAENIVLENFGQTMQPTIGNLGIKIFQANMPPESTVWAPPTACTEIVKRYVMRGGYCYANQKYNGPIWAYDINQAYAAAMRDAKLPAGRAVYMKKGVHPAAKVYIARVEAYKPGDKVPFYYINADGESRQDRGEISDTWLTSIEIEQLRREGWRVTVKESWFWDEHFSMREYVNRLEALRASGPGGTKGAQGEMVKAIGNNSYGKTVEELDGLELLIAATRPEGFSMYQDESDTFKHLWFRIGKPLLREYHQPQLGAFITAHVRMMLRRAILLNPDAWVYADTDGVKFSQPVTLPISATEYGKWKIEAEGEDFIIVTKKVYASGDGKEKRAKGMTVKNLSLSDFQNWYNGKPPKERQIQRQNFLKVMTGAPMFAAREKRGSIPGRI